MSDLFADKNIKPMLIGADSAPFDDDNYIYELKWDGERCIAYLDPDEGTELRNKRNVKMLPKVPELSEIHKQVKRRCILDGELAIVVDGKPNFFEIQRRSLMSNLFKINLASKQYPASFIAFDMIYLDGKDLTKLPLKERKKLLQNNVKENDRLAISRYIEGQGTAFYSLAEKQGLEGIVAKRKDSIYVMDSRTKNWIKIKNLQDDEFVICGYILKDKGVISLVLGQYRGQKMVYKGHVTLGVSSEAFAKISNQSKTSPPYNPPKGNEEAIWIRPNLVCTVKYMMLTSKGTMRQPVFKGLRPDKSPEECIEHYQ